MNDEASPHSHAAILLQLLLLSSPHDRRLSQVIRMRVSVRSDAPGKWPSIFLPAIFAALTEANISRIPAH